MEQRFDHNYNDVPDIRLTIERNVDVRYANLYEEATMIII